MSGYNLPEKKTFEEIELPTHPHLPAWVITPKEEKLIFERWRKKTFARCDELIQAYVACSNSYKNPFDAMRACDQANKLQLECVHKYQTQEYLDVEREILVTEKLEKKRKYNEFLKSLDKKETSS